MKLIAKEDFKWAHDHVRIVEYKADDEIETEDADLIEVATREGWAVSEGDSASPKRKTRATENKPD